MIWHLEHRHDFFILGMIAGLAVACWVFMIAGLWCETRAARRDAQRHH